MHFFPIVWDESIENNYFTKYDYALITLKTSFNMSLPYINPICLPNKLMDIWENPHTNFSVEYTVTGFGLTNSSHTPNYMHFAKVINYPPRKLFECLLTICHSPSPSLPNVTPAYINLTWLTFILTEYVQLFGGKFLMAKDNI